VAGICAADVAQLNSALAGLSFPVDKWQLIDHAEGDRTDADRGGQRAISLLWALPAGRYLGLGQVMTGVARTARGHPRRGGLPSPTRRSLPSPRAEEEWIDHDGPDEPPERPPPAPDRPSLRVLRVVE
jgi:hypothetical protein